MFLTYLYIYIMHWGDLTVLHWLKTKFACANQSQSKMDGNSFPNYYLVQYQWILWSTIKLDLGFIDQAKGFSEQDLWEGNGTTIEKI